MPMGASGDGVESHLGTGLSGFSLAKKPDNPVPTGTSAPTRTPTGILPTFPADAILMKIYECKAGRL